jgi:plastocyanin
MSSSIFVGARTITLHAGQTLRFREPATGGMHVLLAGTRGAAQPQAGAPAALNDPNGVSVYAGQERDLTFAQPGVYHITTLYHDAMQITVVVK